MTDDRKEVEGESQKVMSFCDTLNLKSTSTAADLEILSSLKEIKRFAVLKPRDF